MTATRQASNEVLLTDVALVRLGNTFLLCLAAFAPRLLVFRLLMAFWPSSESDASDFALGCSYRCLHLAWRGDEKFEAFVSSLLL